MLGNVTTFVVVYSFVDLFLASSIASEEFTTTPSCGREHRDGRRPLRPSLW